MQDLSGDCLRNAPSIVAGNGRLSGVSHCGLECDCRCLVGVLCGLASSGQVKKKKKNGCIVLLKVCPGKRLSWTLPDTIKCRWRYLIVQVCLGQWTVQCRFCLLNKSTVVFITLGALFLSLFTRNPRRTLLNVAWSQTNTSGIGLVTYCWLLG